MAKKKSLKDVCRTGAVVRFVDTMDDEGRKSLERIAKAFVSGEYNFQSKTSICKFIRNLPEKNEYEEVSASLVRAVKKIHVKTFVQKFSEACDKQSKAVE